MVGVDKNSYQTGDLDGYSDCHAAVPGYNDRRGRLIAGFILPLMEYYMMPTTDHIANAFKTFVSDERYRKFLRVLNTTARCKRRLLAWQDFLWAQFRVAHPEAPVHFDEIATALSICPIHLSRMTMETVPVEYGLFHFSEREIRARDNLFPFANYMIYGPDWGGEAKTRVVPVCRNCRQALEDWNAAHRKSFGMPSPPPEPGWQGVYFVIEDVFEHPLGLFLAGTAADGDDPWPEAGQVVELQPPTGKPYLVTVLDIDKSITRSCFSDGSAQRAIKIARNAVPEQPLRGTQVRAPHNGSPCR